MNKDTRAAAAYIVLRLATNSREGSIYDYGERKHINIDGDVSPTNINVYDYNARCYVSGDGINGKYNLYHYGNKKHLKLNIKNRDRKSVV